MGPITLIHEFNQRADFIAVIREALQFLKANGGTEKYGDQKLAELLNTTDPSSPWNASKVGHFNKGKTNLEQRDISEIVRILQVVYPAYVEVLTEVNKGRAVIGLAPLDMGHTPSRP